MNIADLIVIGVVVIFVIIGSSKGLMLSIFSLGSHFLAIVVAIKFSPLVAGLLGKTSLLITVKTKITDIMDKILEGTAGESVQTQIDQITQNLQLSGVIRNKMGIEALKETSTTASGMVESLSSRIADLVMVVIAFIAVYIIAMLLLFLVSEVIKKTAKLPVIRSFDKTGGAVFGFIEGLLIIWVLFMIMFMFRASDLFKPVFDMVNGSKIALFLYNNNILLNIVSGFIPKF